jgi:CheY-like chemotaxis protein
MLSSQTPKILLVEDDDVDVRLFRRSIQRAGFETEVVIASDGIEALEVLRGSESTDSLPQPFVVLLDINMPRMNGLQFLDELRKDEDLKQNVVFILTTSNHHSDRVRAYDNFVAGYLIKDDAGKNFENFLPLISSYLNVVNLPQINVGTRATANSVNQTES